MKKLVIFSFFLIIGIQISYTQDDLLVIKGDTIYCQIIETGFEKVKYRYNGQDVVSSKIDHIRLSENPESTYSIQDLMWKLDFSLKSPHVKLTRYGSEIDTTGNRLYWFGIDFSHVVIQLGIAPRADYSNSFFIDANDFILKYSGYARFGHDPKFKEFWGLFNLVVDTGIVTRRNEAINLKDVYNQSHTALSLDSIRQILNEFDAKYNGVGLVVFVTEIDKTIESEIFYLTFFDIESKTVLLCIKQTSEAKGTGMANHWTRPIKESLDKLPEKYGWKEKYQTKQ
ncbi:MAG: hypothetical protein ISR57_06035 [Bacteroidales bacterium]|nr:hypothetical protein [Bacteroidota bacterium]MBL6950187.1 hypothetical protein [Bacteroidales bacterium]